MALLCSRSAAVRQQGGADPFSLVDCIDDADPRCATSLHLGYNFAKIKIRHKFVVLRTSPGRDLLLRLDRR